MLRLGVLDQSPVRSGGAVADAIHETLDLAEACDRLGYHRYWLAEHHSTPGLAGSSPEVLIGQVAARTSRIRVGSGGVMLQHYSPLKVAESFRVLETLFPGRVDLGIGRAPGSDQVTARALRDDASRSTFPNKSPTSWASFTVPCRRATPTRTCWRCRPGPRRRRCGFSARATRAPRSPRTSAPGSRSRISSTRKAAPRSRAPTGSNFVRRPA